MAKKNRILHPLIAQAKREIDGTIPRYGLGDGSENVEPSPSRPLRDPHNARFWHFQLVPRAGERFDHREPNR